MCSSDLHGSGFTDPWNDGQNTDRAKQESRSKNQSKIRTTCCGGPEHWVVHEVDLPMHGRSSATSQNQCTLIYDFTDFGGQLLNGKRLGDEVDASIEHAAVHDGIPRKTGREQHFQV